MSRPLQYLIDVVSWVTRIQPGSDAHFELMLRTRGLEGASADVSQSLLGFARDVWQSSARHVAAAPRKDPLYPAALWICELDQHASVIGLSRHLRISLRHAQRLVEQMTTDGLCAPPDDDGIRAWIGSARVAEQPR